MIFLIFSKSTRRLAEFHSFPEIQNNLLLDMFLHLVGIAGELYCKLWLARVPMWAMFFASSWSLVVINFER